MLPASEPTLAASATTIISAPILRRTVAGTVLAKTVGCSARPRLLFANLFSTDLPPSSVEPATRIRASCGETITRSRCSAGRTSPSRARRQSHRTDLLIVAHNPATGETKYFVSNARPTHCWTDCCGSRSPAGTSNTSSASARANSASRMCGLAGRRTPVKPALRHCCPATDFGAIAFGNLLACHGPGASTWPCVEAEAVSHSLHGHVEAP